jgi:hypothetical protein
MHGARVSNEVRAGPRVSPEELVRQEVPFEAIARGTGGDQVARSMRASMRHRVYVIERGNVERQRNGAIDAASAAIAHGSVLEGTLDSGVVEATRAAWEPRCAGERDSVDTTSRHCTSLEKKKPRDGAIARAGDGEKERLEVARRCRGSGIAGLEKSWWRRSLISLRGVEVA